MQPRIARKYKADDGDDADDDDDDDPFESIRMYAYEQPQIFSFEGRGWSAVVYSVQRERESVAACLLINDDDDDDD